MVIEANAKTGTESRQLNLGFIGVGVGGLEIIRTAAGLKQINLAAAADIVPATRARFRERYPESTVYANAEELCADPDIEAVWVATPNRFHARHAILAANHGKHVVVEKPMAISLQEAEQMVEAAEKNGVKLLAGHTQSYTLPVRAMRKVIESGRLGRLRAVHILSYSDWMLRPRTPDELDPAQGGGIPYRQGPHQVDTVRALGGGKLRSVRAMTGQWMPERPIAGYYTAYLEFEDGTPATIVHNGYGYFLANELVPWGSSRQRYTVEERVKVRKALRDGKRDEEQDKQDMRIGGSSENAMRQRAQSDDRRPWLPADLGLVIVSCERGDIRHSRDGIAVYDDEGIHDIDLSSADTAGRQGELLELYNAVVRGAPVHHDGRWGMATLEVCLALIESAKRRLEIQLSHQVSLAPDYDAGLDLPGW
jgi:phthalate 4,5-cis-dihydrodiol dehydrogenase